MRTEKFKLKMFDTAVTLQYTPDQCKWYEWLKLNEYYNHATFDMHHIIASKKIVTLKILPHNVLTQPAGHPHTDHKTDSHFSCVSHTHTRFQMGKWHLFFWGGGGDSEMLNIW